MKYGPQNICTTPPFILIQVVSRYHKMYNITNPITGEKMILPGRMSAQVMLSHCFEPKLLLRLDFAGAL